MEKYLVNNFSRHAATYDKYAFVQKDIAGKLLAFSEVSEPNNILELGCGTGNYTAMLRKRFPKARITALDISSAMLSAACEKKIPAVEWVKADVKDFISRDKFSLITSNACLQWVDGLKDTIARYKAMLGVKGVMTFSTFGPRTFHELASLMDVLDYGIAIPARDFLPQRALRDIAGLEVKNMMISEHFKDLNSFLRSVKYSGTHGFSAGRKKSLTRNQLKTLEGRYRDEFKEIIATYEVFLCRLNA